MNKMIVIFLIPIVFLSAFVLADENGGITGFDFLRTDAGARPAAMGGAFVAVSADLYGLTYNPAGLVNVPDMLGTFSFVDQLLDINSGFAGFNKLLNNGSRIFAGIYYTSYGEFRRTDASGQDLGSFTSGDLMISAGYADSLSVGLRYGATAKYIYSKIDDYTAGAVAVDLGVIYRLHNQNLNLGLSVTNLGTSVKSFVDTHEKLPLSYRFGISKRLAHLPLLLNFDFIRYHHTPSNIFLGLYWALGGEFTITENFFLRGGYNSRGREEEAGTSTDRFRGISLGFGLQFGRFNLDYGFSTYGVLGNMNRFTLTIDFQSFR